MKRWCAIAAFLLLAACDKSAPPANASKAAQSEFGRWAIVPAGSNEKTPNFEAWSAWRLDTKTGSLEFCTYSIATGTTGKPLEGLGCTQPNKPSETD
jgi:hypothetical protein